MLAKRKGAKLRVLPLTESGELRLSRLPELLTPKVKLVAVTQMSNSLGTINRLEEIIEQAHDRNIPVLVDGAQSVAHLPVDVRALDCDFFVFSGHKIYGPSGIGVLYVRENILEAMSPWQGGGDMILSVSFDETLYNELPYRFEAGTPNIAGAIGLAAALDYVSHLGLAEIEVQEQNLLRQITAGLASIGGLRIIGTAPHKGSIVSFVMDNIHPHDIGTILDMEGIAVRTGHHCTQPVMDYFKIPATTRISLSFYNTSEEVDTIINAVRKVKELMS
jgi:cysteine desulfurase/selenocysteine lyase